MTSRWVQVGGFPGYWINSAGQVLSRKTKPERLLKPVMKVNGYYQVCFWQDGKKSYRTVHRLVAEAFVPRAAGHLQVNHKNGVKADNRAANLEWVTVSSNILHAYRTKLHVKSKGDECSFSKLTTKDVRRIKRLLLAGNGCLAISKLFKVHRCTINSIKRGDSWNHI